MAFHFIVRFEPLPGKEAEFRQIMLETSVISRTEPGCISVDVFESIREPIVFSIHSVWVDEETFELHASLPHTERFIEAGRKLLSHEVKGLRLNHIGGGPGAGALKLN